MSHIPRIQGKTFTAVLRKLAILADALVRDDRLWTPQKP
jgi:hypothetical protein